MISIWYLHSVKEYFNFFVFLFFATSFREQSNKVTNVSQKKLNKEKALTLRNSQKHRTNVTFFCLETF